jgi:hypothetical protein
MCYPFWRCIALFRRCVWNFRRWDVPSIEITETRVESPHTLTENTHTSGECTEYAPNVGADVRRDGGPGENKPGPSGVGSRRRFVPTAPDRWNRSRCLSQCQHQ